MSIVTRTRIPDLIWRWLWIAVACACLLAPFAVAPAAHADTAANPALTWTVYYDRTYLTPASRQTLDFGAQSLHTTWYYTIQVVNNIVDRSNRGARLFLNNASLSGAGAINVASRLSCNGVTCYYIISYSPLLVGQWKATLSLTGAFTDSTGQAWTVESAPITLLGRGLSSPVVSHDTCCGSGPDDHLPKALLSVLRAGRRYLPPPRFWK